MRIVVVLLIAVSLVLACKCILKKVPNAMTGFIIFTSVWLALLKCVIASTNGCTNNTPCPRDRPYCTDIGCVYQCPDTLFANGTKCVFSCDEYITDIQKKECIMTCPKPDMLEFEEIVRIGTKLRKQKICLDNCSELLISRRLKTYRYKNTCVRACPDEAIFLWNNTCVQECPASMPLRFNKTNTDHFIAVECRDTCNFNNHWYYSDTSTLIESDHCVDKCPQNNSVLTNGTCVDECPSTQPLSVNKNIREDYHIYMCVDKCPAGTFINKDLICVATCPPELPFVSNGSCLWQCPSNEPFLQNISSNTHCETNCSKYVLEQYCMDACPDDKYILNDTCTARCPSELPVSYQRQCTSQCPTRTLLMTNGTCQPDSKCFDFIFNGTCINDCPLSHPFINTQSTYMYTGYGQKWITTRRCVRECDADYVLYNMTCERSCSPEMPWLYNRTCFSDCPMSHPLKRTETNFWTVSKTCVNECKDLEVSFNFTCLQKCPHQAQFSFNGSCLSKCPESHTLIKAVDGSCVSHCGDFEFNFNFTCLKKCPRQAQFSFNGSCLSKCPESHTLIKAVDGSCVSHCGDSEFNFNFTCLKKCPRQAQFSFNGSCLSKCPESHTLIKAVDRSCVGHCGDSEFNFNFTCFEKCPHPVLFSFNGLCLNECPTSHPLVTANDNSCVNICKGDEVLEAKACKPYCEHTIFIENGTCTNSCSSANPYKLWRKTSTNRNNYICVSDCGENKYIYNDTCVTNSKCYYPVTVYNRKCSDECPESHPLRYKEYSFQELQCLKSCQLYRVIYNHKCVDECPGTLPYLYNNECIEKCPNSTKYWKKEFNGQKTCLIKCSDRHVGFNFTCVTDCPGTHPYLFNNECFEKCPKSTKYLKKSYDGHKMCLIKCNNGEVSLNGLCIAKYECESTYHNSLVFRGECLRQCPAGYVLDWVFPCQHLAIIIGLALLNLLIGGILIFCCRQIRLDCRILFIVGWKRISCNKEFDFRSYEDPRLGQGNLNRYEPLLNDTEEDLEPTAPNSMNDEESHRQDSALSSVPTVVNVRELLQRDNDIHDEELFDTNNTSTSLPADHTLTTIQTSGDIHETHVKELKNDFVVECLAEVHQNPQINEPNDI